MTGFEKLSLMVVTALLVIGAVSWVLAEIVVFFSKDDK